MGSISEQEEKRSEGVGAAELRDHAATWLASRYPGCIIVPELSVSDWGGASVDLAAITETHIVGIEIKGKGDSPARLDRQGIAYGMTCREMWLLPCPTLVAKCQGHRPNGWGLLELWDGAVRPANTATYYNGRVRTKTGWSYPHHRDDSRYDPSCARIGGHLCPTTLCGTMWRDELAALVAETSVGVGLPRRATTGALTSAIIDGLPVTAIHDGMIRALRSRDWGRKRVQDTRPQEQEGV